MSRDLSKNLASLIAEYEKEDIVNKIRKDYGRGKEEIVPLSKVRFNPISRNQFFKDSNLKDLTESIKNNGVLSPLLVRLNKDGYYEVVGGYKRYYVAKKLSLKEVPVSIREVSDELMIYLVLSRGNKKMHDNILNKTYTYKILLEEYHVTRKEIALISKTSVSQVINILRLNNLHPEVINALKKDKISYGQARVLLSLQANQQVEVLNKILNENISVREVEKYVRELITPSPYLDKINDFEKKNNCKVIVTDKNVTFKFKSKEEEIEFIRSIMDK